VVVGRRGYTEIRRAAIASFEVLKVELPAPRNRNPVAWLMARWEP
jgi:hypothetical protein